MSTAGKSLAVKSFAVAAGAGAALLVGTAGAQADATSVPANEEQPALVHASPNNACKLNVRTGPDIGAPALHTLSCTNYTTCVHAGGQNPCAPFVVGGTYSCVGPDNTQVTDNRWAEVTWRAPEPAYVAVACSAFRTVTPTA